MKVGLLAPSISSEAGGVATVLRSLAVAICERGAEAVIFTSGDGEHAEQSCAGTPLSIVELPVRGPRRYGFMLGLSAALDRAKLDVVHVHGIWMYTTRAARLWAQRNEKPFIVSPHGMLEDWALRQGRWNKRAAWALYEYRNLALSACLHTLTHPETAAVRRLGVVNPVAVIPNGVVLPSPDAIPAPPDWAAGEQRKVLLFLGRLHPKKGLKELVGAWHRLKQQRPDVLRRWVLAIAGWDDGGHESTLRHMVRDLDLSGYVRFLGPVLGEQKDQLLRHADAMILPSHSEGMPISILEAWSYGLPVFMSVACNLPEGFAAGAALEITPDPSNIAGVLSRALDDELRLRRMGECGLSLVAERFTWSAAASEMMGVYRWLAGTGSRPGCVDE